MKPYLKGYTIERLPQNNEAVIMGWIDCVVCAENEKLARMKALHQLREYDIQEDRFGIEFSYITLRLKRSPDHDRFLIYGRIRSREDIEYDRKKDERDAEFKQLLADNPNSYAYIRKGGYYYQPNSCGYTEYKTQAGIYTLDQAVRECLGCSLSDYMMPILIDAIEHNQLLNKQIDALKSRLINTENYVR